MNPINTASTLKEPTHTESDDLSSQSEASCTVESKIPRSEHSHPQGKHIAQRPAKEWNCDYGCPDVWDLEFEQAVVNGTKKVTSEKISSKELVQYCSNARATIAKKRNNKQALFFGKKRSEPSFTCMKKNKYSYALDRAVNIKYDDCFSKDCNNHTLEWMGITFSPFKKKFRYGLVLGVIKGEKIPLTQYVFSPLLNSQAVQIFFGSEQSDYISGLSDRKESGVWLHSDPKKTDQVMDYVYQLINVALQGDLTVIPKLHWWYVHLAPDHRGSGGIAEMITSILCRLHGVDLPPWKEGVAPSVEVLLEPSEEEFCKKYHELFASNNYELKKLFQGTPLCQHSCRLF